MGASAGKQKYKAELLAMKADGTLGKSQVSWLRDFVHQRVKDKMNSTSNRLFNNGGERRKVSLNESCKKPSFNCSQNQLNSEADIVKSVNNPKNKELSDFASAAGIGKIPCVTNDFDANADILGPVAKAEVADDTSVGCTSVAVAMSQMLNMTNAMTEQVTDSCVMDVLNVDTEATNKISIVVDSMVGCDVNALQAISAKVKLNVTQDLQDQISSTTQQNLTSVMNSLQTLTQMRDSSGVGGTSVANSISAATNKQNNFMNASNCQITDSEKNVSTVVRNSFNNEFELHMGDCKRSKINVKQTQTLSVAHVIANTLHNVFATSGSQTLQAITTNAQKEFQKTSTKGADQGIQGMGKWAAIIGGVVAGIIVIGIVVGMATRKRRKTFTQIKYAGTPAQQQGTTKSAKKSAKKSKTIPIVSAVDKDGKPVES